MYRYNAIQHLGAAVIILGVFVVESPGLFHPSKEDSTNLPFFNILFILSIIVNPKPQTLNPRKALTNPQACRLGLSTAYGPSLARLKLRATRSGLRFISIKECMNIAMLSIIQLCI